MSATSGRQVLGVDAAKAGWVGLGLIGRRSAAYFARTIGDLVEQAHANTPVAVVAIDIPIGLPDNSVREADRLARAAIGSLASSVFLTPVRSALDATDHAAAVAVNRALAGAGVSIQAFGLKEKLQQVDRWLPHSRHVVVEVHPEVSFARLAGAPLTARKTTWAGAQRRRDLLSGAGITLDGELGEAGRRAAVDDVLDAAIAAWTARRVAAGQAESLPDPPQRFSDGISCAIWR